MRRLLTRLIFVLGLVFVAASFGQRSHIAVAQPANADRGSATRTEPATPDAWDRVETVSRTLSIAAIPVLLAVVGWLVQRQIQKQSVGKDYVQLAVSILREPDSSKVNPELRGWAVDLLNEYSVVKLSDAVSTVLKAGQATLPPLEGFAATPSPALTPELQNKMQTALTTFQQYLKESGFHIRSERTIEYTVVPGDLIETDWGEYYAYYDSETLTMKVASAYANDVDVIRHEYMRRVLDDSNHGPLNWVEPGSGWWQSFAVSSGIATYFPCSFKGSSVFSANHANLRVELKNNSKFRGRVDDMIRADKIGDKTWGGAFWELRERFDDPKSADRLLTSAWVAWRPTDENADLFVEFANKLIETDQLQNGGQHVADIQRILRRRGLKI